MRRNSKILCFILRFLSLLKIFTNHYNCFLRIRLRKAGTFKIYERSNLFLYYLIGRESVCPVPWQCFYLFKIKLHRIGRVCNFPLTGSIVMQSRRCAKHRRNTVYNGKRRYVLRLPVLQRGTRLSGSPVIFQSHISSSGPYYLTDTLGLNDRSLKVSLVVTTAAMPMQLPFGMVSPMMRNTRSLSWKYGTHFLSGP